MVDVLTKTQRSYNMSQIKGKNTKPEMFVRSLVHRMGYRFRLHRKDLPGKPDMVFPSRKKVIFVHGCFWHLHSCKYGKVKPSTNSDFWETKRRGNRARDKKNISRLNEQGWGVLVVWECWLKRNIPLHDRITSFLGN